MIYPAKVRIEQIELVHPEAGFVLAKLQVKYLNTGKYAVQMPYDFFILFDGEGRQYKGASGFDRHGDETSSGWTADVWGETKNAKHQVYFIECEPAMADEKHRISF